jgi:DNA-directed RNA polymerase subunit RPC12/RpoP
MKNKATLIFSIVLSAISLILIFIGAVYNLVLCIISIICLFTGIIILMIWSTNSYKWTCDECGETFEITLKQNIFGVNAGVNYKNLHCPKCNKKTMCKGIPKQ